MKLEYRAPGESGWAEIVTTRTDSDGYPPVERLRVQWPIDEANVDRAAIASSLVFSPWLIGRCDLLRPFSALTERRIVEWFQEQDVWVAPNPIRAGGLPIPKGTKRVYLSGSPHASHEHSLVIVKSHMGSGIVGNEMRVASNAHLLIQHAPHPAARFSIRLGVAVLLAEAFSVNEFVDPEFAHTCPEEFQAASRMIECVSLGLCDE